MRRVVVTVLIIQLLGFSQGFSMGHVVRGQHTGRVRMDGHRDMIERNGIDE